MWKNRHCGSKRVHFALILKRKIGDQSFSYICVSLRRKIILLTLSGDHIFAYGDRKKNSVASWRLPKNVNFGP